MNNKDGNVNCDKNNISNNNNNNSSNNEEKNNNININNLIKKRLKT